MTCYFCAVKQHKKMKNIFASLALVSLIAFSSCGGAKKEETKTEEVTQPVVEETPVAEPAKADSTDAPAAQPQTK
jgi:hypothetical protein